MVLMDQNENLPIMRYCGNCGKALIANATFCAYCGAPIPKTGDLFPSQGSTPYIVIKTPEITPRHPFLDNFRGAIFTPKIKMPQIASSPNYSQPLLVNLIVGFLTVIGLMIFFSKYEIIFSESFFTFLPTNETDITEYMDLYKVLLPISSPISTLINWLILSLLLWLLHAIFASDLNSNARNYKTMATIVGWAQIPMIINQVITIIYNQFLLSSGGQVVFRSIGEMEISAPGGGADVLFDTLLLGIEILLILWSLVLIYYAIKSLGSFKSNPIVICAIYGVLSLLLPI
jgi:hypothetical protein